MILAGEILNREYRDFYTQVSGYKILDNGVAEGFSIDPEELLQLAEDLDVDEVVAPDVMGDAEMTLKSVAAFLRSHRYMPCYVMGVIQANNWTEFHIVLDAMLSFGVDTIGLPKRMCLSMGSSARLAAASMIRQWSDVQIHCLGCTRSVHEAIDLARQGIVRGLDSAAPAVLGLKGQTITKSAHYDTSLSHRAVPDFFGDPCHGTVRPRVEVNVEVFGGWLQEEAPARPL